MRLEAGDIGENEAATRLAAVLAGRGIVTETAFTGRVNLFAAVAGVLTIDVAARELRTPAGKVYRFPLDGFSQTCLLEGVDQLGWLLGRVDEIERYEAARAA